MEKKTLVVDASVVVKWYCEEEDSDKAVEIREMYKDKKLRVIVPDLLYYEVINAIRFHADMNDADKKRIAHNLFEINFDTIDPSPEHYMNALIIALKKDLTIYDSIYLAITKAAGGMYVTADEEFCRKAKDSDVILLAKWK